MKKIFTCTNCGKHNLTFTSVKPVKCPGCLTHNLPCAICTVDCSIDNYEKVCPYTNAKKKAV
jgi:hypothetical protein